MSEQSACNLCGFEEIEPQPRKTVFLQMPAPYGIGKCGRCGFLFLNPHPSVAEFGKMYATNPYYTADKLPRGELRREFYRGRIKALARFQPEPGTMLGVGCLDGGYSLEAAVNAGWQVEVVEFNPHIAAYARQVLGLTVQVAEGWDLSCMKGHQFDTVYCRNLEHMPDARKTIRQCRDLLAPRGLFYIEVPNQFYSLKDIVKNLARRMTAERMSRFFYGEVAPVFHTFYFNPHTLRQMLHKEGLEILSLRTYLPKHPVYRRNPDLPRLQESIYWLGGLFNRGPVIEVMARRLA